MEIMVILKEFKPFLIEILGKIAENKPFLVKIENGHELKRLKKTSEVRHHDCKKK